MFKLKNITLIMILCIFDISANCLEYKTLYEYHGYIDNKYKIIISLFLKDNKLFGSYIDKRDINKFINLTPKFTTSKKINLQAANDQGEVVGFFHGDFYKKDCNGIIRINNVSLRHTLEISNEIEGIYHSFAAGCGLTFKLILTSTKVLFNNENRYANAGITNDLEFEDKIIEIWRDIVANNKANVSRHVNYPLNVCIKYEQKNILNQQEFLQLYEFIFTPELIKQVEQSIPRNMFSSYTGVMLDNGIIWFNANAKIIKINKVD